MIQSNPLTDPKVEKAREHTPIKGEIPSPVNVPARCRFAGRCPQAMDRCHSETPKLQKVERLTLQLVIYSTNKKSSRLTGDL